MNQFDFKEKHNVINKFHRISHRCCANLRQGMAQRFTLQTIHI